MKLIKKTALAAALSLFAVAASAMTPIADEGLSQVSGQDGVTIGGDLHVNISSFTYRDTDVDGGAVSYNDVKFSGMFVATIDILGRPAFVSAVGASMVGLGLTAAEANTNLASLVTTGVYSGQDVVQIAFPQANQDKRLAPTIAIASIKTGVTDNAGVYTANASPSFGSYEIKNIDLQGTKIWMFAH